MSADTLPEHPSLEGPEWDDRRPLTPEEDADAWKIAQISATLMGPEGLHGWKNWADVVRCGAALLEISRRYVVARERDPPSPRPKRSITCTRLSRSSASRTGRPGTPTR